MCLNEQECVALASSRNFTRRSTPREGIRCIVFLTFLRKPSPVHAECACRFRLQRDKRRGRQTREHTHTDRQTDNLSFIYECNTDYRVRCRSALCSLVFVLFFLFCLFGSSLECPARRLPRKTGWRHLPLKGNRQLSILQSGYSTFG